MENKLNREGIKNYSERFTDTITDDFFNGKERISGKEILDLQPIQQVNLFVLKNLFKHWQKETNKLKSKYFDYEHPGVKEALQEFMNTLSQHISINKKDFVPLFQGATEETVLLIFSPYDFYTHLLEMNDHSLKVDDLKRILKYVKVNRNLLEVLIQKVEEEHLTMVDKSNLPRLLDEVFASIDDTPEDIEEYLTAFTAVVPLGEGDIYTVEAPKERLNNDVVHPPTPKENQEKMEDPSQANGDERSVQWHVDPPQKTLHDEFSGDAKNTLADIHAQQKITSILDNLTINQRFMFINALFDGDDQQFKKVIQILERSESHQAAIDYIQETYPNWDLDSEEVQEFFEVLSKRF